MRQVIFRAGLNIGRPSHEVEPVARTLEERGFASPEALGRLDQRLATQLHIPLRFHAALQDELLACGYEIAPPSQGYGRAPLMSPASMGLPGTGGAADGIVDDAGGGTGEAGKGSMALSLDVWQEACGGPTPRSVAAGDSLRNVASSAFERHLQRHQRAREQKQKDLHAIRISATRWEYWDDPWLDTSSFSRCRRTVIPSAGRGDQPGQTSPRPRASATSPRRQPSPRSGERSLVMDRSVQQGVKNTRLAGNVLSRCRTSTMRGSEASWNCSRSAYDKIEGSQPSRECGPRAGDPLDMDFGNGVSPSLLAPPVDSMFGPPSPAPQRGEEERPQRCQEGWQCRTAPPREFAVDSDDAGMQDEEQQEVPVTCRISAATGCKADQPLQEFLQENRDFSTEPL